MDYSKYITGKEWTGDDTPVRRSTYALKAKEGYWITDNIIYSTSTFSKNLSTPNLDKFGTVTDEEKIEIEALQSEELKDMEVNNDE